MNSVGSVYLVHLLMIFNLFVNALLFFYCFNFLFFLVITLFILIAFN